MISSLEEHFSSSSRDPPKETVSFLKSLKDRQPYIRNICMNERGEDQANISVLYDADFCSFQLNLRKGVIASFQFDIPRNAKQNPAKWLEGKGKRFLTSTQIGIFYDFQTHSFCLIVPDSVSPKIVKGPKFQMDFCIPATEESRFGMLIHSYLSRQSSVIKPPHMLPPRFIFLVPSIFFPMIVPILSGLQNLTAQILPFCGTLASENFEAVEDHLLIPQYLRNKNVNFAAILEPGGKEQFPAFQSVEDASKILRNKLYLTCLDEGQLMAFFRCLLQKIAVIQGPPGTGKSFLGVKLLKTLLQNFKRSEPVLVVCYTNHALDQFLRDLLEGGAVSKADIVRIGGQCKDPLLDQCSFSERIRNNSGKGAKKSRTTLFRLRREASELESELSNWAMIRSMDVSFSVVTEFKAKYEKEIRAKTPCGPLLSYIFDAEDKDGFERNKKPSQIYKQMVKKVTNHAKKRQGWSFSQLLSNNEGELSFPPGRPCPQFLSPKEKGCPDSCESGSHDEAWKRFQNRICSSWLNRGVCKNKSCKKNASHIPALAPQINFPVEELGPPCPFYFLKGDCKKGLDCKFSHDEEWEGYVHHLCFHYLLHGHCSSGLNCPQRGGHVPTLRTEGRDDAQGKREKDQAKKIQEDEIKRKRMKATEQTLPLGKELNSTRQAIHEFFPEWTGFSIESPVPPYPFASSSSWRTFESFSIGKQCAMYLILRETILSLYLVKWTNLMEEYYQVMADYEEAHLEDNIDLLKSFRVIGVTTSGAAKSAKLLTGVKAKVMIVEEAGEVLESHLLTSLTKHVEHLILIGDHQQLRPKINTYRLKGESGQGYDLDCSTFERLVQGKFPLSTLSVQYRMHPSIANLIRPLYSPNVILDGQKVEKYPPVCGMKERLFFFDHSFLEDQADGASDLSKANTKEAEMAVGLALFLMHNGYVENRLALITPYVGQLLKIRSILSSEQIKIVMNDLDEEEVLRAEEEGMERQLVGSASKHLRLATVDNFQGEEADVVIVSTVRCNRQGRIGFLQFDNRVNVMFSRARHGMYVLGSRGTVEHFEQNRSRYSSKPSLYSDIVNSFEQEKLIGSQFECICEVHKTTTIINHPKDWKKVREGGCHLECGQKLPCGHACPRQCHVNDREHSFHQCRKKCMKTCASGEHPCYGLCYENPCPPCRQQKIISLACGHKKQVLCSKQEERLKCNIKVEMELPWCGHIVKLACNQAQQVKNNPEKVLSICPKICGSKLLDCGHECESKCGNCTKANFASANKSNNYQVDKKKHPPCSHRCDRPLECYHNCEGKCHRQGECPPCKRKCTIVCEHTKCPSKCIEPCNPCVEPCKWSCEHQGKCITTCGSPCVRLPCDLRCHKTLSCEHRCPSVCGEPCPSREYCVKCGTKGDSVVDLIMFSEYNDVDVNKDPVCILDCGHLYTISFLDGLLQMDEMFKKDEKGQWVGFLPFSDFDGSRLACPECKQPVRSLRRYGRYIKGVSLLMQRKRHFQYFQQLSDEYTKKVKNMVDRHSQDKGGEQEIEKLVNILVQPVPSNQAKRRFHVFSTTSEAARASCLRAAEKNREWEEAIFVPSPIAGVQFELEIMKFREKFFCLYGAIAVLFDSLQGIGKEGKREEKGMLLMEKCRKLFSPSSHLSSPSPSCPERREMIEEERIELIKEWIHQFIERDIPIFQSRGKELKFSKKITEMMDEAADVLLTIFAQIGNRECISEKKKAHFLSSLSTFSEWIEKNEDKMTPKSVETCKKATKLIERQLSGVFYEKVSDDELREVLKAGARDWGSHVGSYGRFRECPNGHIYVIGECGGAMEVATCNECGERIGGSSHQHLATTRDSARVASALGMGSS